MTTIATFPTPEDAHLFRAYLGSEGIAAYLENENVVQLFWHYSNATGGVRVAVHESDIEEATKAYHTYMEALRAGPYPINPVRAWPLVILISIVAGIPLLLFGRERLVNRVPKEDATSNE